MTNVSSFNHKGPELGNRYFSNNEYEYFIFKEPLDYDYDYLIDYYSNIKRVKDSSETLLIKRKISRKFLHFFLSILKV